MKPLIIAFLGKGGSGKSILSALSAKLFLQRGLRLLLIDADPAMGLATALGAEDFKTIGEARAEIIHQARISRGEEKERLSEIIDFLLMEALVETPDYSLLVMGSTNTVGCYCPVNNLLRETITRIADQYDVVIIDAEAGIEQINREVTRSVHYPILLTDNSLRGAKTAILAKQAIDRSPGMNPQRVGAIFNRVENADPSLQKLLEEASLEVYGTVPADPVVTARDARGESAMEMPDHSGALVALENILRTFQILPDDKPRQPRHPAL
ncbi:AAA family ATPase [Myxococcota bacterium]|nr:AAA family ATPase [Myxococcota bacterium]MBU1536582.1 AAA family ATPase [Myxococcota bacterium]